MDFTAHPVKRKRTHLDSLPSSTSSLVDNGEANKLSRLDESCPRISSLWNRLQESIAEELCSTRDTDDLLDIPMLNISECDAHMRKSDEIPQKMNVTSRRHDWRTVADRATLVVKIQGIDTLSATQMTEILPEMFQQVEDAAMMHNAVVAERRCDCFILCSDTVEQMLAFAVDIRERLTCMLASRLSGMKIRMGVAWGSMTLLGCGFGGSWTACSTLGVRGDAVDLAEQMAEAGASGTVVVHESALRRCAKSSGCGGLPPRSGTIRAGDGGDMGRGAVFDLSGRAFRPAAAWTASQQGGRGPAAGARRLSASF